MVCKELEQEEDLGSEQGRETPWWGRGGDGGGMDPCTSGAKGLDLPPGISENKGLGQTLIRGQTAGTAPV